MDGYEYLKPIMFSAGVGNLGERNCAKRAAKQGMVVLKVGGPAYRIGLGGGTASSKVQGKSGASDETMADLNAVQRGDPFMGNKVGQA
jgi:phosphoribosylformylglycinamidine synthase